MAQTAMPTADVDAALEALADGDRRAVLGELLDSERATVPVTDTGSAIRLQHVHLPSLADAGFIEYDVARDGVTVWRGDRFEAFRPLVRRVLECAEDWSC